MGKELIYQFSAVLGVIFTASFIVIGSFKFMILEENFFVFCFVFLFCR